MRRILTAVWTAAACVAGAATYYVDAANGNDGNDGSEARPFKTAAKGVAVVNSNGGTVRFLKGQYPVADGLGCSKSGAVIEGASGDPADVVWYMTGQTELLRVSRDVTIRNITFSNGVCRSKNYDSSDWNKYMTGGVRLGAYPANGDNVNTPYRSVLSNCVITCCSNGWGKSSAALCVYPGSTAIDCVIRDNACTDVSAWGAVVLEGRSEHQQLIWDNATQSNKNGELFQLPVSALAPARLVRCTVTGNRSAGPGAAVYSKAIHAEMTDCTVSNNVSTRRGGGVCTGPTAEWHLMMDGGTVCGNRSEYPCDAENTRDGGYGGGVTAGSGLTMTNVTVRGNTADISGGGLHVEANYKTAVEIADCVFDSNRALVTNRASWVWTETWTEREDFSGTGFNATQEGGGGLNFCSGNQPLVVRGTVFTNNFAALRGGGLYAHHHATVDVTRCVFVTNTAWRMGGGFSSDWCNDQSANPGTGRIHGVIDRCAFIGNEGGNWGGGVAVRDGYTGTDAEPFAVRNCLFRGNTIGRDLHYWAFSFGGPAVYLVSANMVVDNCTMVDNCGVDEATFRARAGQDVGGSSYVFAIYHRWGGLFRNCLFGWSHTFNGVTPKANAPLLGGGTATPGAYLNCCVWPTRDGQVTDAFKPWFTAANGNMFADPKLEGWEAGNYTPLGASPLKNAGAPLDWMADARDYLGNARVHGGLPDIGCVERVLPLGTTITVR